MDQRDILDHQFVVAAYTVTWVIQLGYLAFLGLKWRTEKRNAERKSTSGALNPILRRSVSERRPNPAGITEFRRLP